MSSHKRRAAFLTLCSLLAICCLDSSAQDAYSIRVEPHQVVVPTFVFLRDVMTTVSQKEWKCSLLNSESFYKLRLSDPYKPVDCDETVMRDLTVQDFHVFEDGAEQKVQDVTLQRVALVNVRDSAGWHVDFSESPQGRWSTSDLGQLLIPGDVGYRDAAGWHPSFYYAPRHEDPGPRFLPGNAGSFYRLAYVPPKSQPGSCHTVRVEVARANAVVFARTAYCSVPHAPADGLQGTKLGDEMLSYAASGRKGKIQLSLQATVIHTDENRNRVDIALAFPWYALHREWSDGKLVANIGVLGLVYNSEGKLVTRFSDFGCCSDDRPEYVRGKHPHDAQPELDRSLIPGRYEAQIDLPSGEYKLQIVLADGHAYGLADSSLSLAPYDASVLRLSSIVLCDRFRDASAAALEDAAASVAPFFLPLAARGTEFSPTGNMTFAIRRLFAYMEIRDPLLSDGTTKLNIRIKVIKVKHEESVFDSGPRDITSWLQPGDPVIHFAQEINQANLPRGQFRLDVEVSDSAGRSVSARSVPFTVEEGIAGLSPTERGDFNPALSPKW